MSFYSPSFTAIAAAPLVQSPAFGAALTHVGRSPLRLSLPGGRGEVQMVRRRFGPLRVGMISRADLSRSDLRRVAQDGEVGTLLLHPETPAGAHGLCLYTPTSVVAWDLSPTEEALRSRLHQKWRNRLAKAERAGLRVTETALNPDRGHWLLTKDTAQARARGYSNWPEALTRAYARANRAQARLFEARTNGTTHAAMLFLCHGSVATYHIGWSGSEGRAYCAHHLILWRAMQKLKARGLMRLDLGSIATDSAPGLARFKLGTGADVQTLGGTWIVRPKLLRGL